MFIVYHTKLLCLQYKLHHQMIEARRINWKTPLNEPWHHFLIIAFSIQTINITQQTLKQLNNKRIKLSSATSQVNLINSEVTKWGLPSLWKQQRLQLHCWHFAQPEQQKYNSINQIHHLMPFTVYWPLAHTTSWTIEKHWSGNARMGPKVHI